MPLNKLPDELLIKIFLDAELGPRSLARLRLACSTWRHLLDRHIPQICVRLWSGITNVSDKFPAIRSVDMSRCRVDKRHVSALDVISDLSKLHGLTELIVHNNNRITFRCARLSVYLSYTRRSPSGHPSSHF